jgi:hypothetical protein
MIQSYPYYKYLYLLIHSYAVTKIRFLRQNNIHRLKESKNVKNQKDGKYGATMNLTGFAIKNLL